MTKMLELCVAGQICWDQITFLKGINENVESTTNDWENARGESARNSWTTELDLQSQHDCGIWMRVNNWNASFPAITGESASHVTLRVKTVHGIGRHDSFQSRRGTVTSSLSPAFAISMGRYWTRRSPISGSRVDFPRVSLEESSTTEGFGSESLLIRGFHANRP